MMKPTKLIVLLTLISVVSRAAILTVNNTPGSAAQFAQIDAALAAATAGDTIYVHGSTTAYNNFTINQSVVIVGPGTYNQTQMQYIASVYSISVAPGVSGVKIYGLTATYLYAYNLVGAHDIEVAYCTFTGYVSFSNSANAYNISIHNNIIDGPGNVLQFTGVTSATGNYNFVISNNIIRGSIFNLTLANTVVQHNLFIGSNINAFASTCANILINNNIFYNSNPLVNVSSSSYDHNISYSTFGTYASMGGTNLDNIDPQFVNVPTTGSFDISYNYHLQSGSPAIAAATDGTDLGVYGGNSSMSTSLEALGFPVIRKMNVQNFNVPQNGNVNINVRSTKSRTN